jgi:hypothetical protein
VIHQVEEESLFEAIAELIPPEYREKYYHRMAHLRRLNPNDEILQVCEAMGFLALITRQTPVLMAQERQAMAGVVRDSAEALGRQHRMLLRLGDVLEEFESKLKEAVEALSRQAAVLEQNQKRVQAVRSGLCLAYGFTGLAAGAALGVFLLKLLG